MSIALKFIDILEFNIVDKDYRLSKYENEIVTYHWLEKNIILDILVQENICAINDNNDVLWFSLENDDIKNISPKILQTINDLIT